MAIKRKLTSARVAPESIGDALNEFLYEKKARNLSPETIVSYGLSVEKFAGYLRRNSIDVTVQAIQSRTIVDYSAYLLDDMEDGVSPASANHYLRELRAFVYWGQEKGYIGPFKIKLIKEPEILKETFTTSELEKLITKPLVKDSYVKWRSWAISNWILATGNRAKTVCNIRLKDINMHDKEIILNTTKAKRVQVIPMSDSLHLVLKEFIKLWRYEAEGEEYLFCNIGGNQLTVNALKHSFAEYVAQKEIAITSIHALRHTFAKEWIRNGGNVFSLQEMLGHSTLEMTRRYVTMFRDDLRRDFESYNPLDTLRSRNTRKQTVRRNT